VGNSHDNFLREFELKLEERIRVRERNRNERGLGQCTR
jgi:hypothetical protein